MARDDFNNTTKRLLAARAGFSCSFPGCNKITSGPSRFFKKKSINTGEAAHITAASSKGPRLRSGNSFVDFGTVKSDDMNYEYKVPESLAKEIGFFVSDWNAARESGKLDGFEVKE